MPSEIHFVQLFSTDKNKTGTLTDISTQEGTAQRHTHTHPNGRLIVDVRDLTRRDL